MIVYVLLGLGISGVVSGLGTQFSVGDLGVINGVVDYTPWSNRSVFVFRGIPYAQPPVGDLRFKPPVKIASWNGSLNASSFGPACPQSTGTYDEDCLTLGVYVPEIEYSDARLLPVLIFIHGGTFRSGSASIYEPYRLLDEDDLIVVVPQFRLGFLGLFSLLNEDVPGNVQFLDQIMAMQWVQDNIEYFGGDKSRVTLHGHSSGAASVHFHLLSPLTKGLFHRTILQSGSALRTYGIDNDPLGSASILSGHCGCWNTTDAGEIAVCMRAMSVEEVVSCTTDYLTERAWDGLTRGRSHMAVIQTSGDQRFLTGDPKELLANGEFLKLPMMGGVTKHDGSIWFKEMYNQVLNPYGLADDAEYARNNLTDFTLKYLGVSDITSSVKHMVIKTYFTDNQVWDLPSMSPGLIDIFSLFSYKSGCYETFNANRVSQDTYIYTFEYEVYDTASENELYPFDVGVTHGRDLKLLFPVTDSELENDIEVAKTMVKLWTSFVINGAPTADDVSWPIMSTSVGPYLVIGSRTSVKENFLDEFVTSGTISFFIPGDNHWRHFIFVACLLAGGRLR